MEQPYSLKSTNRKILVFIYSLSSGGAERVVANLSWYWAEQGHVVTIVTLAGKEQDFYSLHPCVRRIAIDLAGDLSTMGKAIKINLLRLLALRRILIHEHPDLVLSLMTTANVLASVAGLGLPCPVIASERIHPPRYPLGRMWERLRQFSYRWCDTVVALTHESATWILHNTLAPRVVIIPNPVIWPLPIQPPVLKPQSLLPDDRKLILSVGRLDPQKGFDLLLHAFALIAPPRPDWDLVILGDGPERQALEYLAGSLNIYKRVHFFGRAGNIGDWYARTQLYVMSSRFEGFPNTLIESLAAGCPSISFDCDTGPRDIIRHEVDGLLIPVGDVQALSAAIGRLTDDEALRLRFAEKAVEARERFSIGQIGTMWNQLFDELTQRRAQ